MKSNLPLHDIFQWDSVNWSRALKYWTPVLESSNQLHCLELGGREGGISLLAASFGHTCVCSDLENPQTIASPFHIKNGVEGFIRYEAINALDISYQEKFDVVMVKSVITMIGRHNRRDLQDKALEEIYKALKPGGYILFAENLMASRLHRWLRKLFVPWGNEAGYTRLNDFEKMYSRFELVYKPIGFFAAFGRTEGQRNFLGKLDTSIDFLIPRSWRYVCVGVGRKVK
jgi:SAM-dependent methyltransferase